MVIRQYWNRIAFRWSIYQCIWLVSLLLDEAMTMDIPHGESLAWLGDGSGTGFDVLVLESGSECPLISQL